MDQHHIALKLLLILSKGSRGVLAFGYLNVETFNKTGKAAAIVTGVGSFENMLSTKVISVSNSAEWIGINAGMTGAEVFNKICS